jgi:RimJ/RimL family protein N-acetyltransferase
MHGARWGVIYLYLSPSPPFPAIRLSGVGDALADMIQLQTMAIETDRLILRRWQSSDLEPFAGLNGDPRVMEFFPATLSRSQTEAMMASMEERITRYGFGLWAAELKETKNFIGFIGLNVPSSALPFSPCVEIGWRLAFDSWGNGYAQEGARAALAFGFETMRIEEIVSFTTVGNLRSRHVMERIGMIRDANDDFDHPGLPEHHPLRRHVLYRKTKNAYSARG